MTTDAKPMPVVRPRWQRVLLFSTGGRIAVFFVLMAALFAIMQALVVTLGWTGDAADRWARIAGVMLRQIVPTVGAYLLLVYGIERRRPSELLSPIGPRMAVWGFAGGMALIGTVMGLLWIAGAYRVTGTNPEVRWAGGLLVGGLGAAVAEEIVFRGVLYRIVEERWGMLSALAVSALLFGGAHLFNPGATLWTSFAIAVEAGILLGIVYHVTHSLPAVMGLHMAWNFFEGTVFGGAVSGSESKYAWLVAEFSGPDWLTGGRFGVEGSVLTVGVCLAASLVLLAVAARRTRRRYAADNDEVETGMAAC